MEDSPAIALDNTGHYMHSQADHLRSLGPAVRVELPGGIACWSVTSYEVCKQLLANPNVTKSARNHWPAFINGEIPADWEMISWVAMDNVPTTFGKDHRRLRRLIGKAFSTRRPDLVRPLAVELTNMLLDKMAAAEDEVIDLKA